MKIVVLVKQVPDTGQEQRLDPGSWLLDRNVNGKVLDEINERALEVALSYKDIDKATDVMVLSMGPDGTTPSLRMALAMGADSAVHVLDEALAGADQMTTSRTLAAAVKRAGFDLVIAGNESTDGRGGVIPAMLAEHLAVPHLTFLDSVDITQDRVTGKRGTDDGTLTVASSLPAVISVTERAAEPRLPNFRGIMTAKRKPLDVVSLDGLGVRNETVDGRGSSTIVSVNERSARSAGKKIIDDGTAGNQLAEFLVSTHLI